MSKHLGANTALQLLERLRAISREFATREEKLEQEFRLKFGKDRQKREEGLKEEANRQAAALAEVNSAHETARLAVEARHTARKTMISRARGTSKDQALDRIEARTGQRKYKLQRALIEAEKKRDATLGEIAARQAEFNGELGVEQGMLEQLEAQARIAFRGYGGLVKGLARSREQAKTEAAGDRQKLLDEFRIALQKSAGELKAFSHQPLPQLFRFFPVWVLLILCAIPLVLFAFKLGNLNQASAVEMATGCAALILILYFAGKSLAAKPAAQLSASLARSRKLFEATWEAGENYFQKENEQARANFTAGTVDIDESLKEALREAGELRGNFRERVDDKTVRATATNEKRYHEKMDSLLRAHQSRLTTLEQAGQVRAAEVVKLHDDREARLTEEQARQWEAMEADWQAQVQPIHTAFAGAQKESADLFPEWDATLLANWKPAVKFAHAAKFGNLEIDTTKLAEIVPRNKRLAYPGEARFKVPLLLDYPEQGSILIETANTGRDAAIGALNNIILRLLLNTPPGRLSFTIVDPVGLGENFAGIMHLADYGEQLINSRIWTQAQQIEQKLADLNEHMEKVIQMYLRNEYKTIAEYNEAAGNIAERYQFLVIADFPVNFTEVAIKRLMSIANSGARCGVYTLIHWDQRQNAPQNFVPEELRKVSVCLTARGNELSFTGRTLTGTHLQLETPPSAEMATEFAHKIGKASRDSSRVEVPFSHVAPPDQQIWSEETTSELRVPIGRTGATKLQYLAVGKGTRQHTLIAGKTGSGKSTLFHVMITNLALWCSPEQVEFYLVDFKKGVEFKCYAAKQLPHARVVAIESDREFGLSVLQKLDDELKRRGDLFRKLGVQDVAGYKRAGGTEPMPRTLLMIDEFQELFVEDDKVSQGASVLLDRIVRQGRAFGIHVILGSQTLGGAYTVARTTLGQMVIRIALQCNEADAYLIMDDNNPAPRLLNRPGEGIYNDMAGAVEGNSPFQTVWLSDEVRDEYLDKVREKAVLSGKQYPGPIVFEGDAPANVRENAVLQLLLEADHIAPPVSPRIWLGEPNSIKGPTEAIFHRQSGNNLMIVGQREEAGLAMLSLALVTLSAQYPAGKVQFYLFDGTPPGSSQREFLEKMVNAVPHPVTLVKNNELSEVLGQLAAELKERIEDEHRVEGPAIFLLFYGLQRYNKLRQEEDFSFSSDASTSPSAQLNQLITEGTSLGFHVIATLDTYNNVNRFLSKKAFSEFEMRVLFQMSANDSANLSDTPKAGTLGLNRALFYNEQEGYLETFRPYALPDNGWIEQAEKNLKRLLKKDQV